MAAVKPARNHLVAGFQSIERLPPREKRFEMALLECVNEARGMPRHCANHALMHLGRAWKLRKVDPEMAMLRAITAEEEAATAIFASLKQRGYKRANKLSFKNHMHKLAVLPFLQAIGTFLAETKQGLPDSRLRVTRLGNRKVLVIDLLLPNGITGTPEPPLDFSVRSLPKRQLVDFQHNVEEVTGALGTQQVVARLRAIAAVRNRLLYADSSGMPRVEGDVEGNIVAAKRRVLVLLKSFCLVFPYRQHATFVQQAIDGFLLMLGEVDKEEIQW